MSASVSGPKWSRLDPAHEVWVLRITLWLSVALAVGVLTLPLASDVRMWGGLVALSAVLWIPTRLRIRELGRRGALWDRARRFHRLRTLTVHMIDEVKRLNWLSVDARRGIRDREATEAEIEAIEARLHALVDKLRHAAGIEGSAPDHAASEASPGSSPRAELVTGSV